MEFGEKIKEIRTNLGFTQEQFGDKLGFTPDAVSSWERGINSPALDTLRLISETFGVPLGDIIGIPEFLYNKPYHKMVLEKLYEYQLIAGTAELIYAIYYDQIIMSFRSTDDIKKQFVENVISSIKELGGAWLSEPFKNCGLRRHSDDTSGP